MGSEMAAALASCVFMRHHGTDGVVTGVMKYNDPDVVTIVFPNSKHIPLSVVDYLWSHGYSAEMMLLIETALAAANNDDSFINAMALRNFPGAEAGFIWCLTHGAMHSDV
ncbi:hypothetical protein H1R20_g11323, partial [Candolleomyces eurysporus]